MSQKIKRIAGSFVAAFTALTLVSCGGKPAVTTDTTAKGSPETTAKTAAETAAQTTASGEAKSGKTDKYTIYTTFYPMYDFTKKIVGDTADVVNIMPPGTSSHDFEPSAQELAKMSKADVVVYQGAGMEEWIDKAKAAIEADNHHIKFIEAAKGLELLPATHHHHHHHDGDEHEDEHDHDHDHDKDKTAASTAADSQHKHEDEHDHDHDKKADGEHKHEDEHDHDHDKKADGEHKHEDEHDHDHDHDGDEEGHHHHGAFDPHLWLSPTMAVKLMANIKTGLTELKPEYKDVYEKNFETIKKSLDDLDKEYQAKFAKAEHKTFLITHEAFGYLAKEFGLTQKGLSGMGTEQEPNPEKMAEMVKFARDNHIKVVYYDASGSSKPADVLAAEIGAKVLPLYSIHSPSQEQIDKGIDYVKLMRQDLDNILEGLEAK